MVFTIIRMNIQHIQYQYHLITKFWSSYPKHFHNAKRNVMWTNNASYSIVHVAPYYVGPFRHICITLAHSPVEICKIFYVHLRIYLLLRECSLTKHLYDRASAALSFSRVLSLVSLNIKVFKPFKSASAWKRFQCGILALWQIVYLRTHTHTHARKKCSARTACKYQTEFSF